MHTTASRALPTAQFAVREGDLLAANVLASLSAQTTRPFKQKSLGAMASKGHMKGAQVFGMPLSGLPAWLMWRVYYLSQMPTLRRKLRIFVVWTWGMFFPTDITQFHFSGSRALLEADREGGARVAKLNGAEQFRVTPPSGTGHAGSGEDLDKHEMGVYADIVSGDPRNRATEFSDEAARG